MDSIHSIEQQIIAEFARFNNWEDKYAHVIALGKTLQPMSEELKTEANRVRGCQSQVWLHAKLEGDRVVFVADSDAVIVRGLVALLLRCYSGQTPDEILASDAGFLKDIGLMGHLSQSRANGLAAMFKQIRNYAVAFRVMLSQKNA